jgi:hypothetical protein
MRKHRKVRWWLVAVLALSAAGIRAETLRLDFDWRPGWAADVEFSVTRTRVFGEVDSIWQLNGRYTLEVDPHDLGLRITMKDFYLEPTGGRGGAEPAPVEVIHRVAFHPPSYVVSAQGAYLGLTDVQAARARLLERIRELATAGAVSTEGASPEELAAPFLLEETVRARAAEAWQRDVEFWAGSALEVGKWHTLESTNALAVVGGAPVPMTTRFCISRRVSCGGEEPPGCVELEQRSMIDKHGITATLDQYASSGADAGLLSSDLKRLEYSQDVIMKADPGSLRPYEIRITESTFLIMDVDGALRAGSQTGSVLYLFSYRDATPPTVPESRGEETDAPQTRSAHAEKRSVIANRPDPH